MAATSLTDTDTDVLVVGAGPVGTLLTVLLGQAGHRVILVERWPSSYEQPRAVTFDHEIARILSILGIDSDHDAAIETHDDLYYWKNAAGQTLLEVDWNSTAASGWRTRYWFNQPELEARLRGIAATLPTVQIRTGWNAIELEQHDGHVVLTGDTSAADGTQTRNAPTTERLSARFVVGADGANSFIRQQLGLETDDHGYFFDWLILDMIPTQPMHISPAHWQLCDPSRPTTIVPGGPGRRRWEFMMLPGEQPEELSRPESAWALLEPWGVTPANAELERSAVYRFQARWARTWRKHRGLIAGDAAHLMPPFAGEGMCAGMRDALALAWRLELVLAGQADDALLDSYGPERAGHVQHYIDFSVRLGKIICIADPAAAAERDRQMIAELEATDGTPVDTDIASLGPGLWVNGSPHAGELSVQGLVSVGDRTGRFDDIIGRGWIVLGRDSDPAIELAQTQHELLTQVGGRCVRIGRAGSVCDAIDLDDTYHRWFDQIEAKFVVLRPDFYVAASASNGAQLRTMLDQVLAGLHLTGSQAIEADDLRIAS